MGDTLNMVSRSNIQIQSVGGKGSPEKELVLFPNLYSITLPLQQSEPNLPVYSCTPNYQATMMIWFALGTVLASQQLTKQEHGSQTRNTRKLSGFKDRGRKDDFGWSYRFQPTLLSRSATRPFLERNKHVNKR